MIFPIFYRLFSRGIGTLFYAVSRIYIPVFLRSSVLKGFSKLTGINSEESEFPMEDYPTINAFFTRGLKAESRKIQKADIVSPVDGEILEFGQIQSCQLIQAKGIGYSTQALLGGQEGAEFERGSFISIYLSPKDCHRIMAPSDGVISGHRLIRGHLFPVRQPYIGKFNGLYTQNERAIIWLKSADFRLAMVLVGAINVGKLEVRPYSPATYKGDWIGTFHLGSTVVLCIDRPVVFRCQKGPICIGDSLA